MKVNVSKRVKKKKQKNIVQNLFFLENMNNFYKILHKSYRCTIKLAQNVHNSSTDLLHKVIKKNFSCPEEIWFLSSKDV